MSYSKLKPYNLIGVQNKLNRLFGRKLSMRDYFSFAARYLKEKSKESIYEKPYLQMSRPQMHQDWPLPDWYIDPPEVGQYPPNDAEDKYHTYIFSPGIVSIFIQGPAECEETVRGFAGVSLQGPHSRDARNVWSFTVSDEHAKITNVEYFPPITRHSVDFDVEVQAVDEDVEVQICAKVNLFGDLVREVRAPTETIGAITRPVPGALGVPGSPPTVPVSPVTVYENFKYPENCTSLTLEGCCNDTGMAWDSGNSDANIATGGGSGCASPATAQLYITDSLELGGPYTWSVSGTGFWLDAACSSTTLKTSSKNVVLYADADSCGVASITVTGCDGAEVNGSVLGAAGSWSEISDTNYCTSTGGGACNNTEYEGNFKYYNVWVGICNGESPSACHNAACSNYCFNEQIWEWAC